MVDYSFKTRAQNNAIWFPPFDLSFIRQTPPQFETELADVRAERTDAQTCKSFSIYLH